MEKTLFSVIVKNNEQENIIGVYPNQEQAFETLRTILSQNPTLTIDNIWVEEYSFKKCLKVIDIED